MQATTRRYLTWAVPAAALITLLLIAFRPPTVPVDIIALSNGPLEKTVDEEGRTEVRDVFTVAAPIRGRLLRTRLEAGDLVTEGETVVARIEPSDPDFLDPRAQAETEAVVDAARAAQRLAQADLERAEAEYEFSLTEAERARQLFANGTVPQRFVDEAERNFRAAEAAARAAAAAVDLKARELIAAQARLIMPIDTMSDINPCACADITSPVSGRVLRVFEKSETVVVAGTPLLEIGNPEQLEIVADYLSTDAVRIKPGMPAIVDGWGGDAPLQAVVRRVEPFGYTKVSALGIEEQRVNVVFDITSPRADWQSLGHGYRVNTRVILWRTDNADNLPQTALFRHDDRWAVFVVDDDVARLRPVDIGRRAGLDVQIVNGITSGELVILHPNDKISDGVAVKPR